MSNIVDRIKVQPGTFLGTRPGYYFGHGLESQPEIMDTLLGRSVTAELGVVALGHELVVQEIDQLPNMPTEQLGGKSPQQIVAAAWQRQTDTPFSAYSMRPTGARSAAVVGTLYEIDMEDAVRLVDWNFVLPFEFDASGKRIWPGWKSWDNNLELADGRKVDTLTIDAAQPYDRVVDGMSYGPYLNDKHATFRALQGFVDELDG